jgi:hypothetical protein
MTGARNTGGFGLSLAATVMTAAVLAACGSSHKPQATAGSGGPLQVAKCMRAHGVTNFPDPTAGGGISITPAGGGISITPGDGLNTQSPTFRSAIVACKKLLGPKGPPHSIPASFRRQAIANAQCMREHGVPNFPDPQFPAGGGMMFTLPSGVSPNSPAFQQAQRICGAAVRGARKQTAIP